MKKLININLQGFVISIEELAYEKVKTYLQNIRQVFQHEIGLDEIINDIEARIAELMNLMLKDGKTFISTDDIDIILSSMGEAEQLKAQAEDISMNENQQSHTKSTESVQQDYQPKRLTKDISNKIIGGVCSGIANYFNIDPIIIRLIFVFTFAMSWIVYIILWIVLPQSTASEILQNKTKKLYRNEDDRFIGGVCSGIANYFNIEPWIVRLVFLIPLLSSMFSIFDFWFIHINIGFMPSLLFVYIILWILLPSAKTTAQKLYSKGQKVNIDSIKKNVQEKMQKVNDSLHSEEFQQKKENASNFINHNIGGFFREFFNILGKVIKVFSLVLLWIIFLTFLFSIGTFTVAAFMLKTIFLSSGLQSQLFTASMILWLWIPLIGLATYLIRRIIKAKKWSTGLVIFFSGAWVIGWICLVFLVANIANCFKVKSDRSKENIYLNNAKQNSLYFTINDSLTNENNYFWSEQNNFELFHIISNWDSKYAQVSFPLVDIEIYQSPSDSFNLSIQKLAYGKNLNEALNNAATIDYSIIQQDSVIYLDKGILLNFKQEQFRGQNIRLKLGVPQGKMIYFSPKLKPYISDLSFNYKSENKRFYKRFYKKKHVWKSVKFGRLYLMTKDGLENMGKIKNDFDFDDDDGDDDDNNWYDNEDDDNNNDNNNDNTYDYTSSNKITDNPNTKTTPVEKNNQINHSEWLNILNFLRY